jgi:hypothetical protein
MNSGWPFLLMIVLVCVALAWRADRDKRDK